MLKLVSRKSKSLYGALQTSQWQEPRSTTQRSRHSTPRSASAPRRTRWPCPRSAKPIPRPATLGRPIAQPGDEARDVVKRTLPEPGLSTVGLRRYFRRVGLSDQELVALMGAHTLGRLHQRQSAHKYVWTA